MLHATRHTRRTDRTDETNQITPLIQKPWIDFGNKHGRMSRQPERATTGYWLQTNFHDARLPVATMTSPSLARLPSSTPRRNQNKDSGNHPRPNCAYIHCRISLRRTHTRYVSTTHQGCFCRWTGHLRIPPAILTSSRTTPFATYRRFALGKLSQNVSRVHCLPLSRAASTHSQKVPAMGPIPESAIRKCHTQGSVTVDCAPRNDRFKPYLRDFFGDHD